MTKIYNDDAEGIREDSPLFPALLSGNFIFAGEDGRLQAQPLVRLTEMPHAFPFNHVKGFSFKEWLDFGDAIKADLEDHISRVGFARRFLRK